MEPDSTFFVWGDAQGLVTLSHAACGLELIAHIVSIEVPAALTAITGHTNCPAVN